MLAASVLALAAGRSFAGGSGMNVVVVVNQASSNSVELGNYYCERRQVPPQNLLRINWAGGNTSWTFAEFQSTLFTPLQSMLAARGLTNQIDFVVLSMDLPYRITSPGEGANSTTAALFYGFKPDARDPFTCPLATNSSNAYAGSEDVFRNTVPGAGPTNFVAVMLTAGTLAQAKSLVDQGVNSDHSFPTQTVVLSKTYDVNRNVRFYLFDNALFNARLRGNYSMLRTNSVPVAGQTNLLGFQTGFETFAVTSGVFVPGAMADNLTSFGGDLFENTGQTSLLAFIQAGASGSYGTVIEPCNYLEKFPDPQNYFYQARGFSLAECYLQSLVNPYEGLIVGEPLAAPFARSATGSWSGLAGNAVLAGSTNLSLQCNASDASRPVQQVDLFFDAIKLQTLTNLPPRAGNVLQVSINGFSTNYTVPASATIKSAVSNLVNVLNHASNATLALAIAHGDRVELQSLNTNVPGAQVAISVSGSIGSADILTTFLAASRTNFLDSIAAGVRSLTITGVPAAADFLQIIVTKTNGTTVTLAVTNSSPGPTSVQFAQQLVNLINNTAALQSADGAIAESLQSGGGNLAYFELYARQPGFAAAQLKAVLTATPSLVVAPVGNNKMDENLGDLQPRNHLFLTAGRTNLSFSFPLDTTALANGYHELSAVIYEGSHVRTQARITQNVIISNGPLAATLVCLVGGSNAALEATLQFAVTANTISKIELFSTGGLLAVVSNLSSATFSIAGTNLGLGLHPFYAVVTDTGGKQFRTATKSIRLVGPEAPFLLQIFRTPVTLRWPAVAGRSYDVMSATVVTNSLSLRATVTPTNAGLFQWIEPQPTNAQRYYRVRLTP